MKTTGNLSLRRFCLLLFMLVSYTDTYVLAAPRGGHVVSGAATFQQDGNLTTITAGNRSVINYGSFNIAPGETVRFVQPSANSSVLNRVVGSANPTEIFGSLQANGHVYIVNPYGIFFRNGSVINVGGLYAGAGNLSDADFTKGKIHFTDLAGDVRNDGIILANDHLALMGVNVVNTGTLRANTGVVVLVSGQDVYVGEKNSSLYVRANGNPATTISAAGGSVVNRGTVAAPRVLLGGGDLYSTAIANSGLLQGRSVVVNAGHNGTATVSGTVDASSAHNPTADGTGGSIQVLGGTVALKGAALDASGTTGGGSVRVGGDFHGGGTLAHATTTTVDAATTIKADATGDTGNGGTVVLWSDGLTSYSGQISANAGGQGGDGGQVEVSSHGQLGFDGGLSANAPHGKAGSLLLDPTNIDITADGSGTATATGIVGAGDATPTTITARSLENLPANVNIDLEATQDIRIEDLATRTDGNPVQNLADAGLLNLAAGTTAAAGSVTFRAGVGGTGSFVMVGASPRNITVVGIPLPVAVGADTIVAPGRNLLISASGPSTTGGINGTSTNAIAVGNLNTSSTARAGGTVSLLLSGTAQPTGAAPVQIYAINSSSTVGAGGAVSVSGVAAGVRPTAITFGSTAASPINTAPSGATTTPGTITLSAEPTNGTVTFAAGPTFTGNTTLTAGSFALPANGTFNGGGHDLTLSLNQILPLTSIANNSVANFASLGAPGVAINVNTFTTTGSQVYGSPTTNGPITLSQNAMLNAGNNGGVGVTINGPLDSSATTTGTTTTSDAHTLTINTGGITQINAALGSTEALGGFTTDYQAGGNDATVFNVPGGPAVTTVNNGTAANPGGAQNYGDSVLLAANTTLVSRVGTGPTAGTITFALNAGTFNASGSPTGFSLGITNPGVTIFTGAVGGGAAATALASLATGTGTTNLNGGSVITDTAAGQTYNGPTVLGAGGNGPTTTLTATNGPIVFNSTLDGTTGTAQNLSLGAGTALTFNKTVGTTPLASLQSTTAATVNINGGAVTTNGTTGQVYQGAVVLGSTAATPATTLTAGAGPLTFNGKIDGATGTSQALTLATATTGAIKLSLAVGSSVPLASFTVGVGPLTLMGGSVLTSGLQSYNSALTLGAGTTLASNAGGAITINGTINGAQTLVVNTSGATTFGQAVGGTTRLTSLTTDAGGTTTISGGSAATTGAQTFNDALTLGNDTILTAGSLAVNSTFDGGLHDLTLTIGANVTVPTVFTNIKNFTSNGAGGTTINGNFSTTGSQTYGNAATLGAGVTLTAGTTAGNPSDITFGSTLDGAFSLTLNTPGNEVFNGLVGGATPLLSLTTDAAGTVGGQAQFKLNAGSAGTGNPAGVNVAGGLTINDGTLLQTTGSSPAHPTIQTTGAQLYQGAVTLGSGTLLKGTGAGALGAITFGSTVQGPSSLTLATPGTVTFGGVVGGGTGNALANLTISAGVGTVLNTTGVTTTGVQLYNGPLTLGNNVVLTTSTADAVLGAITFNSPIRGAGFDLTTATQGGNTVFGGGSGSDATSLVRNLATSANGNTVFSNAAFETSGSQTYQGPATPGVQYAGGTVVQSATNALTLTSDSGNIIFGGALTSPASATVPASDLTVTANAGTNQSVTFGGAVGGGLTSPNASALNSLTVNSPTINVDGGVVNTASTQSFTSPTAGLQTYNGAVMLGADTTFIGKTLTASGGVNGQSKYNLTLTFSDQVTVPLAGGFTGIVGFTSNGAGGTNIAGDFATTGFQHYDNATTLGANVTLSAGAPGIRFGSTLGSPGTAYTLALSTSGPVEFDGAVGGAGAPLQSLGITGGTTTSINGGAITTADFQNYGGPVSLGAAGGSTTLTSDCGQIAFSSTLDGATAGTQSLTLNTTGTIIFTDLVGASRALRGLTTGSGTADINSASVTTQGGGQNYQGPVSFDGVAGKAVALTDKAGGALNFGSTVDNFAGGAPALTLSTGGAITFTGAVGSNGALGSLTTTGGGTAAINGGSVVSSGFQDYTGPVTLGNTATLASTGGGDITFASTLDGVAAGAQGLTLNTAGNEIFGGLVGNKFSLASLTTDAAGTVGGQTRFNVSVGGAAQGVNVAGDVTINDAALFAATGSTLTNPTVRTGGSQAYNGGGTATQNTVLIGGGTLTSVGALDFGGNDLSVRFGGQVTVPGAFTGVRNFASDGPGGTLLNGTFTTVGTQTYGDAVTLDGTPVLSAVGNLTFNSTVDGNVPLTLNVTGANGLAVFNGLVGNTAALFSLTTNTTGGTQFKMNAGTAANGNGGVNIGAGGVSITGPVLFGAPGSLTTRPTVRSVGAQTYQGAATLGADTVLVGAGDITFGSTVDGGFRLSASSAGNEVFDGLVGGASALTGLITDEVGIPAGQAQFNFAIGGAQAGVRVNGPITLNDAARFNITGASVTPITGTTTSNVVPSVLTLGNGVQTYVGTVTLGTQTVFVSTTGAPTGTVFTGGGQITFNGSITSADPANRQNVYVRTDVGQTRILGGLDANTTDLGGATATFHGLVGPVNLFSVESNAGTGGTVAVGGNVTTSGAQTYNAAVILPVDSVFTAGGNIVFNGTVDSDLLTTPRALTLNTAGLTIFNGLVGSNVPLLSLTTDNQGAAGEGTQFNMNLTVPGTLAGVQVINAVTINDPVTFNALGSSLAVPTILTGVNGGTGSQTYASTATLLRDAVLTDLGSGDITFGSTVNGGFNLFVNTGGDEIFNGLIGNNVALASLQTDLVGQPEGHARFNMSLAPAGTVAGVRVTGIVNVQDGAVFNAANNAGTLPTILSGGAQTYARAATLTQDAILTSTGHGDLTFGSTVDGAFALKLGTGGTTLLQGVVGSQAALASLTTDAAGSTHLDGGTVTTTGFQTYNDPVLLGANTAVSSGTDAFFRSTVDGPFSLSLGVGNSATFNAAVGGTSPLASLTALPGSTLRVNGGAITTSGAQTYGGAVLLGADATLTSIQALNVTFNSTLNGAFALTINTGGITGFNGQVGTASPLASLTTDAAGSTNLNGKLVVTSGAQTYGDPVTLGAGTILSSTANGQVLFSSTVDGPFALTINTGGVTRFDNAVGSTAVLASLTTDAAGSTVLNGGPVFTTGGQTFGDVVTLTRDAALTSQGAGDLLFGRTVDGAFALTLNTGGVTRFGGAVGGTTALASLTTDAPGSTQLDGGSVRTTGAQTYLDTSTLGVDTTLASTGGNVLFGSTLDSAAGTARNLTVNTTSLTEFDGLVGGVAALGSLTTDAGGVTVIRGGGITTVNNGTTTGAQTYNDALSLGANTVLTSFATGPATTGGSLLFNSTVDGAFALTLNTGALTVFNGVVGGAAALTGLTTDNAGAAGEGTQFNMTVGNSPAGVVVNGAVQINDAVLFNVKGSNLAQPGVLTLGDHGQAYNGAVALGTSTYLISATALPAPGAGFTGGGGIRFNGPAGIRSVGGNDLYVRGAVGTTAFNSTINVGTIDLGGAQATFNGPINLPGALSVLPNDGGIGGLIEFAGGGLTTAGTQNYRVGVILGANTTFTSLNTANDGGNITFGGTVDSDSTTTARTLMLNTNGDETFDGLVGNRGALASLTTDALGPVGGTARFDLSLADTPSGTAGVNVLGAVTINDVVNFNVAGSSLADGSHPTILSGGPQTYNGAATLAQNTTLVSSGGGNLLFNSTVDGGFGLALSSAGDEVFNGLVGRQTPLASLATDVVSPIGGQTRFNMDTAGTGAGVNVAGAVTINDGVTFNAANVALTAPGNATVLSGGTQTYDGPATLSQNTTLTSSAGNLVFNGTLDGGLSLATNSGGVHAFNGLIGSVAPLASLTTNGGGTQFNASLSGSAAAAGVRIDGPLMVNGTVEFNVAGSTAAQPSVLTLGASAQTYNGAATLAQSTVLGTGSGNLTFNSTTDGAFALTLNTAGVTTLGGAVGGITPLASLATDAGGTTLLGAGLVVTSGAQSYGDAVDLAKAATLNSTNGGALTFGSGVNGAFDLTLNSAGQEMFNGPIGNVTPLASLTTDADAATRGGSTVFNFVLGNGVANSVLTTGAQTYNDGITLKTGTVLTSQNDAVTAASVEGNGSDLTINAATSTFGGISGAGNLLFAVRGVTTLNGPITGSSLAVRGGSSVALNAGTVTTTVGGQSYEEPVTLGVDTTLGSAGLVNVSSLDGGNHALTLTAPAATFGVVTQGGNLLWTVSGQTTFNGAVDAASLRLAGNGPVALNGGRVTTTGNQLYSGSVTLGADTALSAVGATINVGSLSGKNKALAVTARRATFGQIGNAGVLDFANGTSAVLNGTVAANSLDVTGDTSINGGTVRTDGDQNYRGNVALGAAATLTSAGGAINSPRLLTGNGHDLAVAAPNATFGQIEGTGATTFQDGGVTTLNGTVDAGSVTVSGGQRLALNGGRVTTSASQDYAQPVTLGGDTLTASRGTGNVSFDATLDGARNLTVDTAGTAVFGGMVGGTTRLTSLTVASGAAAITGGSIQTTGNQQYNNTVTTSTADPLGTRLTSDAADLVFNNTVTGNGGALFVQGHRVLLHGDTTINGGNLSLSSVEVPGNAASALLLLDGRNYVSNGGSVTLNGADSTTTSSLSTIVLTNTGTVNIRGANFTMGYLQKLFADGALNIDVGRGVATVGDLAARQTLRISAREIDLLNRPAGVGDGQRPNTGLNFVADQGINFGNATIQYARSDNQSASFITTSGVTTIQRRTGLSIFRDPNLDTQFRNAFTRDGAGFFLVDNPFQPVGGGSQTLDTAAAISGALPDQKPLDVPVDVTITASQMEELRKLGIHPRKAQSNEQGSLTARQALFAQLADGQDTDNYGRLQPIKGAVSVLVPSDYVVVVNRMSEREVRAILQAFEQLYGKDKEKAPQIGAAYQKGFDEYTVAKQTAEPAGFGPYLKENQGKYPDVDQAGRGFDNLFGYIEHMGLTPVEVQKAESHIVSDLNVNGPTPDDMVKVIDIQRRNLPPAQKAGTSKLPPAPPMAAPAPAPAVKKEVPPKSARATRKDGTRRTAHAPKPTPKVNHGPELAGL